MLLVQTYIRNSVLNSSGRNQQRKLRLSLSKELKVLTALYLQQACWNRQGTQFLAVQLTLSKPGGRADYAYQKTTDPRIFISSFSPVQTTYSLFSSDTGKRGPGGQGGPCPPPPQYLAYQLTRFQPGEGEIFPPITTGTPNVFHLPASLFRSFSY